MAGMILADFGADVVRVDRPFASAVPTPDVLARGKRSIAIDPKVRGLDWSGTVLCSPEVSLVDTQWVCGRPKACRAGGRAHRPVPAWGHGTLEAWS